MLNLYQPTYLATPVENLFIEEFMIKAPGEFVKVYLYGLRFAVMPMDEPLTVRDFSRALNIDEEVVINAFCYWDRAGIVKLNGRDPLDVQYLPVQQVFQNRLEHRELYRYQELNQTLQSAVGAQRLLTHDEFQMVYDWIEQLGMEEAAVPLLVSYLLDSRHNKKLSFAYMDKVVRSLALEKKITTANQVEEYINGEILCKPARDVLSLWNIHRNATLEEGELWARWTRELNFEKQGILTAAKHMAHISSPNFRYLDKMLESLAEKGIVRAADIRDYYESSSRENDRLSPILRALGSRSSRTDALRAMAASWFEAGISQASLEKMAASLSREGRNRPEDLDALVRRQVKAGKTADSDIKEMLDAAAESREAFGELLVAWGEDRAPTPGERKAWSDWRAAGFSPSLIAAAAEVAMKARDRVPFMNAVLANWKEQGITTAEAARAEAARRRPAEPAAETPEHDARYEKYLHYFDEEDGK